MCKFQTLCKSAIVILIWNGFSAQATVYNSDGSSTNIQYIHDSLARDGDIIILPSGTFLWSSGVTISKGITLQGQTTTDSTNGTAVDNTIIQDSDARRRPGGYPFITVNSQAGKSYRITGLTIDGGGATIMNYNGAIILKGNSHLVRVDHMNWRANVTRENNNYLIAGSVCGVADHIVIKNPCESYAIYNETLGHRWNSAATAMAHLLLLPTSEVRTFGLLRIITFIHRKLMTNFLPADRTTFEAHVGCGGTTTCIARKCKATARRMVDGTGAEQGRFTITISISQGAAWAA